MLRSVKKMLDIDIEATDGEIGHVEDFFFDCPRWALRYMVVDTGPWILGRQVLISVYELGKPDWEEGRIPVSLNKAQIKGSPDIGGVEALTRDHEVELHDYYGWHRYWLDEKWAPIRGYAPSAPSSEMPEAPQRQYTVEREADRGGEPEETVQQTTSHLRKTSEVFGYTVQARDGVAGFVYDFLVDDQTWEINYLIADTGVWLQNRLVMFAPAWTEAIDYGDGIITIDLSRETIKNSPEYDPERPVGREDEQALYDHYGYTYGSEE